MSGKKSDYSKEKITELGLSVFDDNSEKFEKFMSTDNDYLKGKTPREVCETEAGRIIVHTLLNRIEHGIFV